jgi:hypothetical protein
MWRRWLATLVVLGALGLRVPARPPEAARAARGLPDSLSAPEFARLIRDLSEPGGYYQSDNFVSNETSYLHVVEKLGELNVNRGAYIGVGPEQNFTYIARIRPRIAFIVDIRRQAMIQHLLYKAVFHVAATRAEFLSLLLCRPLEVDAPAGNVPLGQLLERLDGPPGPQALFLANLARIRGVIEREFEIPLSAHDEETLAFLYSIFRREGLAISYHTDPAARSERASFPTFKDLLLQPDLNGDVGSFLADDRDYEFLRALERRNLVVPVVGDFAGSRALAGIGRYLAERGCPLRAFYVSNVEEFLFRSRSFDAFAANVGRLPFDSESVFIRAFPSQRGIGPGCVPGHLTATVLQKISEFMDDFRVGRYSSYDGLLGSLESVSPDEPRAMSWADSGGGFR